MRRCSGWWATIPVLLCTFACSGEINSLASGESDAAGGAGGTNSSEGGDDVGGDTARACPPTGPFGVEPGDIAPDVVLYDCDGTSVHLHDLCSGVAAYIYTHAGWCGTCKQFAQSGEANAFFYKYKNDGLRMWFVITSTESSQPPTQDTCRRYRDQYGLNMTILYDPDGVTEALLIMGPNGDDLVLVQGNVIEINGPWAISTVEDVLNSILK